jgi:phosphatidate phosphatase APP1
MHLPTPGRPLRKGLQHVLSRGKQAKRGVKRRLHLFAPLQVVPFTGHGTPHEVFVSGRLLERDGAGNRAEGHGWWTSLRASVRRFESDEIPGASLSVRLDGEQVETRTDEEGFFHVALRPKAPLAPGWHAARITVRGSEAGSEGAAATGHVLVPSPDAEYGIISDLDDTVITSHARHRLQMVRLVVFKDAHTRSPFPGVAPFYRALSQGPDGRGSNPLFYLSNSAWNLYDLFERFLEVNDLPPGPLFLCDAKLVEAPSRALGGPQDKRQRIRGLLALYPSLRFVLVGDSGQKDPEVYRDVVREHPGRIRAIYIRDVTSRRRDRQVHAVAEEVRGLGVPMALVRDTAEAAERAAAEGLLAPGAVEEVRRAQDLRTH